jgi:hypothetical protein
MRTVDILAEAREEDSWASPATHERTRTTRVRTEPLPTPFERRFECGTIVLDIADGSTRNFDRGYLS